MPFSRAAKRVSRATCLARLVLDEIVCDTESDVLLLVAVMVEIGAEDCLAVATGAVFCLEAMAGAGVVFCLSGTAAAFTAGTTSAIFVSCCCGGLTTGTGAEIFAGKTICCGVLVTLTELTCLVLAVPDIFSGICVDSVRKH